MNLLTTIRLVEIEVHSYCNRKCIWCPNKFINRQESITALNPSVYTKLLIELKEAGFAGAISYSRYNEPMATPKIFKQAVTEAKGILPNTKLVTNTNGDFITKENLSDLLIDELTVMDYDCVGIEELKDRFICAGVKIDSVYNNEIRGHFNDMKVLGVANWPKHAHIEDRGGSLKEFSKEPRHIPCYEPTYFVGVDYNSNVTPCCHIRSDNQEHEEYILGNLKDKSLNEILSSPKAVEFRRLRQQGMFDGPCMYCQKREGRYTRINAGIEY